MTPREALDELIGRVPSAQSQHLEPARLVLAQTLDALDSAAQDVTDARTLSNTLATELANAREKIQELNHAIAALTPPPQM